MLQDVLASRITEVDFMNGAIVKWGEKYGVPTPLNQSHVGVDQGAGAFVDGAVGGSLFAFARRYSAGGQLRDTVLSCWFAKSSWLR